MLDTEGELVKLGGVREDVHGLALNQSHGVDQKRVAQAEPAAGTSHAAALIMRGKGCAGMVEAIATTGNL